MHLNFIFITIYIYHFCSYNIGTFFITIYTWIKYDEYLHIHIYVYIPLHIEILYTLALSDHAIKVHIGCLDIAPSNLPNSRDMCSIIFMNVFMNINIYYTHIKSKGVQTFRLARCRRVTLILSLILICIIFTTEYKKKKIYI